MDFNTFLLTFGLDPDNFTNKLVHPEEIEGGFIYRIEQRTDIRECPFCHGNHTLIKDYNYVKYRCSTNQHERELLEIKKARFYCPTCHKTFTNPIKGIKRKSTLTSKVVNLMMLDFTELYTFKQIAERYHLTQERVIQLFDEKVPFALKRNMPRYLCIDEIKFSDDPDNKYICILSDFETGEIVDVIRNRQMAYMNEYFSQIPLKERENTKVFISDMYDAYSTVCSRYFPHATHVVDLFHIILQMTNATNQLRVRTMNLYIEKGTLGYNFMKQHWKYFLCRREHIPNRYYKFQQTGECFHYDEMVERCSQKNEKLLTAHNILQDLYHYQKFHNFTEALDFVNWIINKLMNSECELLESVGKTYRKWRIEIANTFSKLYSKDRIFSNGMAEGNNNLLSSLIKISYGCHNFQRFRRRILLIKTYNQKKRKEP